MVLTRRTDGYRKRTLGYSFPLICRMGIPILLEHLRHPVEWVIPRKLVLIACVANSSGVFSKGRLVYCVGCQLALMYRGAFLRTLAIIGPVLLPHRQMLLDAFVSTCLPYEIRVIRCKARKMCCILCTCRSRPLVAVVIMPKCENAIAAHMEGLDDCGNRIPRL